MTLCTGFGPLDLHSCAGVGQIEGGPCRDFPTLRQGVTQ